MNMGEMADYYGDQDGGMIEDEPAPDDPNVTMGTGAAFAVLWKELVTHVGKYFASDPSRASCTFSLLADGTWYGSVIRYTQPYGEGRVVVTRASSRYMAGMLVLLAQSYMMCVGNDQRLASWALRLNDCLTEDEKSKR